MSRTLQILAPTRYPWRFNSPRQSRHRISIRNFVPFNKFSPKIEGITLFNPLPPRRFDLIHAFNRIPLGTTPFLIGFESHLPRAFGLEDTAYFRMLSGLLANDRCRAIVAISEYARRQFLKQHAGRPWQDALAAKLHVRYPNIPTPPGPDTFNGGMDKVRLVFVGNHFARKGGSVALRIAELAEKKRLPVEVDIVSSLETGAASWVGPTRDGYHEREFQLLHSLANVRHHGSLPNAQVLDLVKKAHFLLLPTFSDTFGFSALEAMAQYTPVIATNQGALPEFIEDGGNGFLLPLETDAIGEWAHIERTDRDAETYEKLFESEVERLAQAACTRIETVLHSPADYQALRLKARATAEKLFSATAANDFWDNFYCEILP